MYIEVTMMVELLFVYMFSHFAVCHATRLNLYFVLFALLYEMLKHYVPIQQKFNGI